MTTKTAQPYTADINAPVYVTPDVCSVVVTGFKVLEKYIASDGSVIISLNPDVFPQADDVLRAIRIALETPEQRIAVVFPEKTK